MTLTLEHSPSQTRTAGDEALAIINAYRSRVEDHTAVRPLETEFPYYAHDLGKNGLYLASLDDNLAGAFKWRGALVGAKELQDNGADRLVVPSAGNHARGAVLAAKLLDMSVSVVVPRSAPPAKRDGIRDLWPSHKLQLNVVGDTFDESLGWAMTQPGALLHPYDNPAVASGQGTVVDDVLRLQPDVSQIVVPVGGGGLLSGVLGRLEEVGRTDIAVVGAEAEGSNSLSRSLATGELTAADRPNQRYGGSAVQRVGAHTLAVCQRSSQLELVTVTNANVNDLSDNYEQSRYELLRTGTPNYEPTSLVAVAALAQVADHRGPTVVLGTGHNEAIYPKTATKRRRLPM